MYYEATYFYTAAEVSEILLYKMRNIRIKLVASDENINIHIIFSLMRNAYKI